MYGYLAIFKKLNCYLSFTTRSLFDFILVRGVTFNTKLDFLQTTFTQNKFGNVAILDVPEESKMK
jgi:hypothetical protein